MALMNNETSSQNRARRNESVTNLKREIEQVMQAVTEESPRHPEYPSDMIDKLWDNYHEERENLNTTKSAFNQGRPSTVGGALEYVDGHT